jgi:hypothetical protein
MIRYPNGVIIDYPLNNYQLTTPIFVHSYLKKKVIHWQQSNFSIKPLSITCVQKLAECNS